VEPSLVSAIPLHDLDKPYFFRVDAFHALHKGFMGDIAANALVCCYDHEFFGDLSFEDFCATCFSELKEFCAKESKTLHMTQLSRPLLGFGRSSDYPTAGWFKGADTVCILEFLESRIGGDLIAMSESRKPIFLEIHATISAANAFMRCMYRAGLWLSHEERDFLLKAGTRCVNSFLRCALRAFNASATRWKFMPKFHLFGEWLFTMEKQKRLGLPSPNLLMFSCQMDEDYVGRIGSISRTVSLRTVHTRTLTRYLIALVANWG
ncbi:unnamed protein product, partial [Cladocopium goreaui]